MAKSMETSKKLVYISDAIAIGMSVAFVYATFFTEVDTTNLAQVTIASLAEATVANGFYYWKSKNENRYKYVIKLMKEWAVKYGVDAVIRLAEVVLKD